MCSKSEIESESDDLECPGCYKSRSYAWSDGKCNSCGYDEIEESERANNSSINKDKTQVKSQSLSRTFREMSSCVHVLSCIVCNTSLDINTQEHNCILRPQD